MERKSYGPSPYYYSLYTIHSKIGMFITQIWLPCHSITLPGSIHTGWPPQSFCRRMGENLWVQAVAEGAQVWPLSHSTLFIFSLSTLLYFFVLGIIFGSTNYNQTIKSKLLSDHTWYDSCWFRSKLVRGCLPGYFCFLYQKLTTVNSTSAEKTKAVQRPIQTSIA